MNKQSSQWKSRLLSALAVAQRDLLSLLPHLVPNQPPGGDGGAGGGVAFCTQPAETCVRPDTYRC